MAEFPALPLFTDAYLADTRHLSTLEHGAYLLLLMEAWRRPNTALPNDDTMLGRLAGVSASEWHAMRHTILAFFVEDKRTLSLSQKRLTDEKNYVKKTSQKQRSRAKSRWNKEKRVSRGSTEHDAEVMPDECPTDAPTPTIDITKEVISINRQTSVRKRGSRISDDFKPDVSCKQLADELGLTNEQRREGVENFKDYWKGVPGQKGCKLDWQATFRNQIRFIAKGTGKNYDSTRNSSKSSIVDLVYEALQPADHES